MNCANHPQSPAVAYCRTCGKPLCTNCTRPVMGVIYCESCVAERMGATAPPPGPYQQPGSYQPGTIPPATASGSSTSGPNPALAGILGAIPFGVGAIYNGQYTKGLAHLGIFILLVIGANQRDPLSWICGIGIAAFVLYQRHSKSASQLPIHSAWPPCSVRAGIGRTSRAAFQPARWFSSAWVSCSCCITLDCGSLVWTGFGLSF